MYSATHISYFYQRQAILSDASLTVKPGKLTALLGPNGAGKSTLLQVLAGRLQPQQGQVLVEDRAIKRFKEANLAAIRAVLPQQSHIQFPYTVKEIVMMGCVTHPTSHLEKEQLAVQQLAEVGFQYPSNRSYLSLSGGEQQRVQLARVLAQISGPVEGNKYLLLDEPTSSLDLAREQQFMQIIRQLCQKGIGVLAIIHDLNLAIQYADELILMKQGKVIDQCSTDTLIESSLIEEVYGHPVQFLTTTATNRPIVVPMSCQSQIEVTRAY